MRRVTLIPGTWGWNDRSLDWYEPGSPFTRDVLQKNGIGLLHDETFMWTTGLGGLFFNRKRHWEAGAYALHYHWRDVPYLSRNLITHSHGVQVALLYAALFREPIHRLIDVCGPVREDVNDEATAADAVRHIGRWVHVYTPGDWTQVLGSLFDGHLGWRRENPLAHRNVGIRGIRHSGLFNDPALFHFWTQLLTHLG